MHFSTLLVLYCKYLGASLFQRRLCLSRVGFVNASPLSFIPCPTVTRRFFLPFYKQPKNGSRAGSYDEHPYLWALPFPLFSTLFFLPLLPLFTFEGAGGAGGSVLFQLLSHAPSCPGFHLRHMQYRCEKVSVRIGYVPFFYTSVLFLSGLGVNIMKKKKTVQRENLCDSRQVKPKAHAWHALPPFSSPSRELPRPCMGTRGAVRGSRVRNCRTPRVHLRACPAPSSFRQQKEGSTA